MAVLNDYSTRFEHGADRRPERRRDFYTSYTRGAVMRYRAASAQALIDEPAQLVKLIKHHREYQVPRLNALEAYYVGNNPQILSGQRRMTDDASDHRIRHGFATVISNFLNTYVLGNPVKLEDNSEEGGAETFIEAMEAFNWTNDIDSHNLEIGKDQNNMGRAYELLQRDQEDRNKIYRLDPREVFMIYDETVATRVVAACRYFKANELDDNSPYRVELYTDQAIIYYQPVQLSDTTQLLEDRRASHKFSGVPIVEYRSDRYRMSVYEGQLSLIDAYDAAQSDTANYMTDFNDAIMVLEGNIKNAGDADYMRRMKDARMMVLVPDDSGLDNHPGAMKASYLTKSYDVAGVEAYKNRIKEDIFNTAAVPNLSDDAFSGQSSGEALKYKLFGLQQKKADKEKFLAKGFRVRYKLLENILRATSEYTGPAVTPGFIFTPNLPKAYLEELKLFTDSGGAVSERTKLGLLSFVPDVAAELEQMEAEQGEAPLFDLQKAVTDEGIGNA